MICKHNWKLLENLNYTECPDCFRENPEKFGFHSHSPTAVLRSDGSLDPLRGKCDCGKYFESNPYGSFKKKEVSESYVANLMGWVSCGVGWHQTSKEASLCGNHIGIYQENGPKLGMLKGGVEILKNRMTPDETFIQWLKIAGGVIIMIELVIIIWKL